MIGSWRWLIPAYIRFWPTTSSLPAFAVRAARASTATSAYSICTGRGALRACAACAFRSSRMHAIMAYANSFAPFTDELDRQPGAHGPARAGTAPRLLRALLRRRAGPVARARDHRHAASDL